MQSEADDLRDDAVCISSFLDEMNARPANIHQRHACIPQATVTGRLHTCETGKLDVLEELTQTRLPQDAEPKGRGVLRRTVVVGAAWALPVVAVAVATPLAAASTAEPTLQFAMAAYTVSGCGTLDNVVVTATTNGTTPPPAGTAVSIALPAGYTFVDGQPSPRVLLTDPSGSITLPAIKAPASSGPLSIAGQWNALSAATAVTASAAGNGGDLYVLFPTDPNNQIQPITAVPMRTIGLPANFKVKSYRVAGSQVLVTLADNTIWVASNRTHSTGAYTSDTLKFQNTGLTGSVADLDILSGNYGGESPYYTGSYLVLNGQGYYIRSDDAEAQPVAATSIPNPPSGGAIVRAAMVTTSSWSALQVETADGRLWLSTNKGVSWTAITGFPTPIKSWVGALGTGGGTTLIGADGLAYSLSNSLSTTATRVQPAGLTSPAEPIAGYITSRYSPQIHAQGVSRGFVNEAGAFYFQNNQDIVNASGALAGVDLRGLLYTSNAQSHYVLGVVDGALYYARNSSGILTPLTKNQPSPAQLGGATIVDAWDANGSGSNQLRLNAVDSLGRVWTHSTQNGWSQVALTGPLTAYEVNDGPFYQVIQVGSNTCPV
ncbi:MULTISPECIES: hypothetical protein [unclassified Microbacterium]|uniref:hypothetical protein n=1 Tax=unclassified Microbacterium TaxID=2609290 RepID=UPI00109CD544|nr:MULTISPECIES: hypothetical protein [unclassified Microbacterium]